MRELKISNCRSQIAVDFSGSTATLCTVYSTMMGIVYMWLCHIIGIFNIASTSTPYSLLVICRSFCTMLARFSYIVGICAKTAVAEKGEQRFHTLNIAID